MAALLGPLSPFDFTVENQPDRKDSSKPDEKGVLIVIPTRNAASFALRQVAALQSQTIRPTRVLVIDSASCDGSPNVFRQAGYEVVSIRPEAFDHGATRNLAITLIPDTDFIVYLTQDAILHGNASLHNLIRRFDDPSVGLVYGRQLPRDHAGAIERHARAFNYGASSTKRSLSLAGKLGIKAIFASNSFAAYRRSALEAIDGFPSRIIMGEDQIAVAKMLIAGWTVAYAGDAEVIHSHGYSVREEFSRYFDIGVFHAHHRSLLSRFGTADSEGRRFVLSELTYLLSHEPTLIPEALFRTALKLVGYRLGRFEALLPNRLKTSFSMHDQFFLKTLPISVALLQSDIV